MANEPGRNEPCPCGSGEKYKHCCINQTAWYKQTSLFGAGIVLVVLTALILLGVAFYQQGSGTSVPDCPTGEVWSEAHGHCH